MDLKYLLSETLNTQICFKKGKIQIQGKKSSRAGRKKAPHFEVLAQKGRYKEYRKGKKVVALKDGYKVATAVVLRRNGGVFSIKNFTLC